jgi:hypothetical protein
VGNDFFNNFVIWRFAIESGLFVLDWRLRFTWDVVLGEFLSAKPILFGDHSRVAPRSFAAL